MAEEKQRQNRISIGGLKEAKPAEQQKKSDKDPYRLKAAWERLQRQQEEIMNRRRKSKTVGQISSVRIVKDSSGKETVQIDLVGGGRITDTGDKRAEFQKMKPQRKVSPSKIRSLMKAVAELGFAAVAANLSPEMRAALRRACERNGISVTAGAKKKKNIIKKTAPKTSSPKKNGLKKNELPAHMKQHAPDYKRPLNALQTTKNKLIRTEKDRLADILQKNKKACIAIQLDKWRTELYGENGKAALIQEQLKRMPREQLDPKLQRLLRLKEIYGIQADPAQEKLTPAQKENRAKMTSAHFDKAVKRIHNEKNRRSKAICSAKVLAFEVAAEDAKSKMLVDKEHIVSEEILAKEAFKKVPPPEKRDIETLVRCKTDLSVQKASKKQQNKKQHEVNKAADAAVLKNAMCRDEIKTETKTMKKTAAIEKKAVKTKSPARTVLDAAQLRMIQELSKRKQASR